MTTHISKKLEKAYLPLWKKPTLEERNKNSPAAILATDIQVSHTLSVPVPQGTVNQQKKSKMYKTFTNPDETMLLAIVGSLREPLCEFTSFISDQDPKLALSKKILKGVDFEKDIKKGYSKAIKELNLLQMNTPRAGYNIGSCFGLTVVTRNPDEHKVELYRVLENGEINPTENVFTGSGGPDAKKAYDEYLAIYNKILPKKLKNVMQGEVYLIDLALERASQDIGSLGKDIHVVTPEKIKNVTRGVNKKVQKYRDKNFLSEIKSLEDLAKRD